MLRFSGNNWETIGHVIAGEVGGTSNRDAPLGGEHNAPPLRNGHT
jgi:hypothetical protein